MTTRKKITLILIVAVALVVIFYILSMSKKSTDTAPAGNYGKISEIEPGKTTYQEVILKIGQPKSQTDNILTYPSKSLTRDNVIKTQGNIVSIVKEMIAYSENRKTLEIKSTYGDPEYTIYGPDSVNGNYLFVYPQKGIAFIGNPETESMTEIWHFTPVESITDFIDKWAPEYTREQSTGSF